MLDSLSFLLWGETLSAPLMMSLFTSSSEPEANISGTHASTHAVPYFSVLWPENSSMCTTALHCSDRLVDLGQTYCFRELESMGAESGLLL